MMRYDQDEPDEPAIDDDQPIVAVDVTVLWHGRDWYGTETVGPERVAETVLRLTNAARLDLERAEAGRWTEGPPSA